MKVFDANLNLEIFSSFKTFNRIKEIFNNFKASLNQVENNFATYTNNFVTIYKGQINNYFPVGIGVRKD